MFEVDDWLRSSHRQHWILAVVLFGWMGVDSSLVVLTPLSLYWPLLTFTHPTLIASRLLQWLIIRWFPWNFSYNESILLSLFATRLLVLPPSSPGPTENLEATLYGRNLAFATLWIAAINYSMLFLLPDGTDRLKSAVFWVSGLLIGFFFYGRQVTGYLISQIFEENYRLILITYWAVGLFCTLPLLAYIMHATKLRRLDLHRKFFHFLAVFLFLPPVISRPVFMTEIFASALALLAVIEMIRLLKVDFPLGLLSHRSITYFFNEFTDRKIKQQKQRQKQQKTNNNHDNNEDQQPAKNPTHDPARNWDGGPLILSHLMLLVGCALPLFLAPPGVVTSNSVNALIAKTAGIITIGVGDSFASIIGRWSGRRRWRFATAGKSLEGSAAFFLSTFIAWIGIIVYCADNITPLDFVFCLLVSSASALIEAVTSDNDNLILPGVVLALCRFRYP